MWREKINIIAAVLLPAACAMAQGIVPPLASPDPSVSNQPPRDIPLAEKKWEQLSNQEFGPNGKIALAMKPEKWKHAETENFVVHFRRATEAHKVVREIEYNLWFVAKSLGATPDQYRRKSHAFVFEDENEWKDFLADTGAPPWFGSFAFKDELFLNIRHGNGVFDSHTLAHETTHAVVARLYPSERWPVWLSEGFAEYMGGASVAARNHQWAKGYQKNLNRADLSLDDLFALQKYPEEQIKIAELYQTGEKFVRFLMNELPKERFRKFVETLLKGGTAQDAFIETYGDKFNDFDKFKTKFAAFSK